MAVASGCNSACRAEIPSTRPPMSAMHEETPAVSPTTNAVEGQTAVQCSHLGTESFELPAVRWYLYPYLPRIRGFGKPNEGFYCLQLAEEESAILTLLKVMPVFEKPSCYASNTRITRLTPSLYSWAYGIYNRYLYKDARVVE